MLPPLKPIPIKERMPVIFIEKGEIDVVDGAFVVVDCLDLRVRPVLTHIPVGGVACIMLEPGTRVWSIQLVGKLLNLSFPAKAGSQ